MFKKNDIRRLYWLIEQYLAGKITERTFCDEYYYCYDLELDYNLLSEIERKAFKELSSVSSRYSEFEEDIQQYPGVYFTKENLKLEVVKTKEKLKKQSYTTKNNR